MSSYSDNVKKEEIPRLLLVNEDVINPIKVVHQNINKTSNLKKNKLLVGIKINTGSLKHF